MARRGSMVKCSVSIDWPKDINLTEINQALDGNLKVLADDVRAKAKASAAFSDKTGELRKTIRIIKLPKTETNQGYFVRAGGKKARQAWVIEFGHDLITRSGKTIGHVPAHPFLRPAAEAVLNNFINSIGK